MVHISSGTGTIVEFYFFVECINMYNIRPI